MQEQQIQQQFNELKRLITQPNLSQKKVLTLREAAIYSGRALSNLYKLTSSNKIPHSKPEGKMVYIDREEFEKWLLKNPIRTNAEINKTASTIVTLGRKGGKK